MSLNFIVEDLFEPKADAMPITDPVLKHYGRIWIPLEHIEPTKALRRWLSGTQQQPSLCVLHQAGQCNGSSKCSQAHVRMEVILEIRRLLQARPFSNCCLGHGDLTTTRSDFQELLKKRPVELMLNGTALPLLPKWIAFTLYFDCYLTETSKMTSGSAIRINASRVCNLHQRQECKYGSDCRNIHLCRQFWACLPAEKSPAPIISGPIVVVSGHLQPSSLPTPPSPVESKALTSSPTKLGGNPHSLYIPPKGMATTLPVPPSPSASKISHKGQLGMTTMSPKQSISPTVVPVKKASKMNAPISIREVPTFRAPSGLHRASLGSSSDQGLSPCSSPEMASFPKAALRPLMTSNSRPGGPLHVPPLDITLVVPRSPFPKHPTSTPQCFGSGSSPHPSEPAPSSQSFCQMEVERSPSWYVRDGEPLTPNAMTAEEFSSQGEAECSSIGSSDDISDGWADHEEQALPVVIDDSPLPATYADILAEQTIFQSLTFDLLEDAAVDLQLPWHIIEELQQAVF